MRKPVRVSACEPSTSEPPSLHSSRFSDDEIVEIRSSLLRWYDANHRVLPWRRNPHSRKGAEVAEPMDETSSDEAVFAYRVWVSEIMLQQTQVATVKAYFARWMARYPSIQDLASSDIDEVNKLWAGLGYYRRARFLLEGAKFVCENLGGKMPSEVEELRKIPGIGMYTASAIASIVFAKRAGVVDGNVIRVLSRLRALTGDPKSPKTTKLHWQLSNALVDPDRPGCFNQALMELGATLCTPKGPTCLACPVSKHCEALSIEKAWEKTKSETMGREGKQQPSVTDYPTKVKKKPPRRETLRVGVLTLEADDSRDAKYFLLVKRPTTGLLPGLWEFPNVQLPEPLQEKSEKDRAHGNGTVEGEARGRGDLIRLLRRRTDPAAKEADEGGLGEDTGLSSKKMVEIGSFDHVFSHIKQTSIVDHAALVVPRKTLYALRTSSAAAGSEGSEGAIPILLLPCDSVEGLKSLSTGVRKAIKAYTKHKASPREKKSKQNTLDSYFKKT